MPTYQTYNPRIKAYVKYKKIGNRSRILDVKQKDPAKPFKGIPMSGKKK